jgi:hypothetical protein
VERQEILLGFDARRRDAITPREQLAGFLLRPDAVETLSVDTLIWPSAVEDTPAWIGMNAPFWEDIVSLRRHVSGAGPHTLIAATWHFTPGEQRGPVGPYISQTTPIARDPGWQFLGYDVADPTISGLSNCGYTPEEMRELTPIWAPRLNDRGLFEDEADAAAFRDLTNQRVPEHAPFFVIGLWLIGEVDPPGAPH